MYNLDYENLVFLVGLSRRCGTNYLDRLLSLHPDIQGVGIIKEDLIFAHLSSVSEFVEQLNRLWHWDGINEYTSNGSMIFSTIGKSILEILVNQPISPNSERHLNCKSIRYLTKSPVARNIHYFDEFFPSNRAITLIRHPFDAIYSMKKAFGMTTLSAAKQWKEGANALLKYQSTTSKKNILIVKYEDLRSNTKGSILNILEHIGMSNTPYDFDAAYKLPPFGATSTSKNRNGPAWRETSDTCKGNQASQECKLSFIDKGIVSFLTDGYSSHLGYKIHTPLLAKPLARYYLYYNRLYNISKKLK